MKYIKLILVTFGLVAFLSVGSAAALSSDNFVHQACSGTGSVVGSTSPCSNTSDKLKGVIKNVVNVMSFIVGILAVIMLLVAGIRYVISGGESNNVAAAKNTLIYALVGLAIAVLAQVMVHLVLNTTNNAANTAGYINANSVINRDS